jgi:hypothetical protein
MKKNVGSQVIGAQMVLVADEQVRHVSPRV